MQCVDLGDSAATSTSTQWYSMTSTKFGDKRCSDCSPCCINVVIILPLDYGHAQYITTKIVVL